MSTVSGLQGQIQRFPDPSGSVTVSVFRVDGKPIIIGGHRHSHVVDDTSSWSMNVHRFAYSNPAIYDELHKIANSKLPEIIIEVSSGGKRISREKHWITACHDVPNRAQGSRELRLETSDLMWAMNRKLRIRSRRGRVMDIVAQIASTYGLQSHCFSESLVTRVQSHESDYAFILNRLRPRAVVREGQPYGDCRLSLRYDAIGNGILSFAPLQVKNRVHNWWLIQLSDPRIKIEGEIEVINAAQIAAQKGAAGIRAVVIDPYRTTYADVVSENTNTSSADFAEVGVTDQDEVLHTVCVTVFNDGMEDPREIALCARDKARLYSHEMTLTVDSGPWFASGDRITISSGLNLPYDHDWFVEKVVTTITSGNAVSRVKMISGDTVIRQQSGIRVQDSNTPSIPLPKAVPAAPAVRPAAQERGKLPVLDPNTGTEIGNSLALPESPLPEPEPLLINPEPR